MLPHNNANLAKMVNSQETSMEDNKDLDVVLDKFQLLTVATKEDCTDLVRPAVTHACNVEMDKS
jgi:hypothetical protein